MSYDAFDALGRRCPMLGSDVTFAYCRALGGEASPCRRALACWEPGLPAEAYFRLALTEATFHRLFVEPAPCPTNKLWEALDRALDTS